LSGRSLGGLRGPGLGVCIRRDEQPLDLELVQRDLCLEAEAFRAADAHRVAEVAPRGGADQEDREAERVRDEHAVRRDERHGAEPGAENGEDDRIAHDASRRPPGEVFRISFDDARVELSRGLHSVLIGRGRGRLEVRNTPVERLLQIGRSGLGGNC
jgi:hypothetical protein